MSTGANELLRALGGGMRPAALRPAGAAPMGAPSSPGAVGFAELLSMARAGQVSSNLPVTVAKGADVNLSDEQLRRVGVAMDRAEAAGATRALVLIDGVALRVDVGVRQITGQASLDPGMALSGIDGVVAAPVAGGSEASVGAAPGVNEALLRALRGQGLNAAGAR